ncbi:MAG: Pycsar system effector family protein [Fidelibacterota bacterium]
MIDRDFSTLFQVLSSEQQIIRRTDQKAFTMLSILGVFMVFFIVHFLKVQLDWFKFVMVIMYFISALLAIVNLVLVVVPRFRREDGASEHESLNPTFFAGISKYPSPEAYAKHLREIAGDEEKVYNMFATQVFSLAKINSYKNVALRRSVLFFVVAILSELLIIMSMAWSRAIPFLFHAG